MRSHYIWLATSIILFFFNNKKFLISRLKIEISQKCYLDYVLFLDLRVILIGFNSSFIAIRDESIKWVRSRSSRRIGWKLFCMYENRPLTLTRSTGYASIQIEQHTIILSDPSKLYQTSMTLYSRISSVHKLTPQGHVDLP